MKRWLKVMGVTLAAVLGAGALLLFTPITDPRLAAHPDRAANYSEAASRIESIVAQEQGLDLIEEGHSIALLTGSQTTTSVVIFHGYTSVPRQFRLVAEGYRAQGMNVWVPRLPYHGQVDRMTEDFSKITAEGLRDFADDSIDIAAGLGEHVIVIGFSGGGGMATWAGAEREEVARTVLISPLLHPLGYPEWQARPLVRAIRLLPFDIYDWWDAEKKDADIEGYNYPRYSLKGIAALLSLGHYVDVRAADGAYPALAPVLLVRNDGDQRLDSAYNERYARRVARPGHLEVYRIPARAQLLHNFISPEPFGESYPRITEAYRYLSEALGVALPDPLEAARE